MQINTVREAPGFAVARHIYIFLVGLQDLNTLMVETSYILAYHTACLTQCYVISYGYELWKITSIQCTFVVSYVASTSQAHNCYLTLHNGLFVWLLHTDLHTTYIKHTHLRTILSVKGKFENYEPGITRHILHKIITLRLLLIHVI